MDFETRAIHVGQEPDPATGAVTTPIYQTSTYAQEAVGVHKGYDYARVGNPTRTALEECLASLENAAFGLAFSSGLGAATTIMHLVDPGQRLVCVNDVYGGMYRMFSQVYEPKGYDFDYITPDEVSTNLAAHLDERTRIVWVESPTNPLLNIVDLRAAADAAHAAGALLVVDNTFATPYLQQPLELGADIVVHSTTKYLGGHSDVIGGFAATNDPTIAERLRFLQKSLGAVPGPFDAWLVLRGLKTLAVRMRQHCENARAVVAFLQDHPSVTDVLYPGLPDHPGHEIAARQMRDFGGMVSFLVESEQEAVDLVARTKLWTLAESLGGVESLIEHPARMTHASTAEGPFASPGNLVRLSAGIESADDLVEDLAQALAAGSRSHRVARCHSRRPSTSCTAASRTTWAATSSRPTTASRCSTAGRRRASRTSRRDLPSRGLELGDVSHLLLSHIHFDHAGATGALVRANPSLQVHVSAVGAPHLVEPSRLEASARRLYGDTFDALWGELVPVPAGEHPRRRRRRARTAVLPEHRPREPPRLDAARRRHALRGRLDGRPHRARALRPAPDPAARHRSRGLGGDDRGDRAPRAGPARADPLRRLRGRSRPHRAAPHDAAALGRPRRPRDGRGDVRRGRPGRLLRLRPRRGRGVRPGCPVLPVLPRARALLAQAG